MHCFKLILSMLLVSFFIIFWEAGIPAIGDYVLYDEKYGDKAVKEIEYKLDTLGYNYNNLHTVVNKEYKFNLLEIYGDGTKKMSYTAYNVLYVFEIDRNGTISNPKVYRKGRMTSLTKLLLSSDYNPELIKEREEKKAKENAQKLNKERAVEYDKAYIARQ